MEATGTVKRHRALADKPAVHDGDRSFFAFVRVIRTYPGFGLRVASAACFLAVLVRESGIRTAAIVSAVSLGISFLIGYPVWRRTGTR
jgi:hypothetical protein